jgi:hypothetical protein
VHWLVTTSKAQVRCGDVEDVERAQDELWPGPWCDRENASAGLMKASV